LRKGTAAANQRALSEAEKSDQEATKSGPARVCTSLRVSFCDVHIFRGGWEGGGGRDGRAMSEFERERKREERGKRKREEREKAKALFSFLTWSSHPLVATLSKNLTRA
jgi:hypothetical protein